MNVLIILIKIKIDVNLFSPCFIYLKELIYFKAWKIGIVNYPNKKQMQKKQQTDHFESLTSFPFFSKKQLGKLWGRK